jgi:hypothetical protein
VSGNALPLPPEFCAAEYGATRKKSASPLSLAAKPLRKFSSGLSCTTIFPVMCRISH